MYNVVENFKEKPRCARGARAVCMQTHSEPYCAEKTPSPPLPPRPRFVQDRSLGDLADHSAGDGAGDDLPTYDLTGDRLLLHGLDLLLPL